MAFLELRPLDEVKGIILKYSRKVIYLNDDGFLADTEHTSPLSDELLSLDINDELFRHKYANRIMAEDHVSFMAQYERLYNDCEFISIAENRKEGVSYLFYKQYVCRYVYRNCHVGTSYEEIEELFNDAIDLFTDAEKDEYHVRLNRGIDMNYESELESILISIYNPIIIRLPENTNRKTFDMIKVEMYFKERENTFDIIKRNKKEVLEKAIQKIKDYRSFKKYGVPINILKFEGFQTVGKSSIMLIFGVKKV